ncbi:MAG: SAVED domain-containing protein [Candidatus Poribacteria bacterium]|nr:SAVED domain-containing protein [Candidatus Poribacteria bacterium]
MAKAINARRKGDEYQARVFWLKLLEMRTGDYIQSVTLESDRVSFVDDVVVSYCEPIRDRITGKQEIVHDFFQCKYHMTQHGAFTHENLIDPSFINCEDSMLKRLYHAYVRLSDELGPDAFRLYIFSNWHWDHQDVLAEHLHEGMIRPTFYERGPRSERGKARAKLAFHLEVSEEDLLAFLNTVRFTLGKNLTDLEKDMEPLLKLAGLQPIDPTGAHILYDDLPWKLFGQGQHSFDKQAFNRIIDEEKLKAPSSTEHSEISIQSFSQFARRPRDLQANHLDLRQFFEGRFPKDDSHWKKEISEKISAFMLNEELIDLPQPIHFFFDCHLSIAFLAGSMISPKHGISVIPTQKNGSDFTLWEANAPRTDTPLWKFEISGEIGEELVLGISVTHQVQKEMEPYLKTQDLNELPRILVCPIRGIGPKAVSDGDYAWQLGYQLAKQLREMRLNTCRKIHLFFAVPVALGYILGSTLGHITPIIQLYEHDFEGQRYKERYYPSLRVTYQP